MLSVVVLVLHYFFIRRTLHGKCYSNQCQCELNKIGKGSLVILLYSKVNGFPEKVGSADSKTTGPAKLGSHLVKISAPKPGDYAISVFHDENNNSEIDTNWLGIPKEGIGVSNNAKGRMGPPKYKDSITKIDENYLLEITLKYL